MRFMLANLVLRLLPPTRCFAIKRFMLNLLGINVGYGANVCGGVQFFGGGNIKIGKNCWVGINTKFISSHDVSITVGDNCDIAPEVLFMCGSHEMGDHGRRAGAGFSKDIVIGPGCWIGARTTVLGGVSLGDGSIVGSASLVRGSVVEPDSLIVGVPARTIRQL